MTIENLLVSFHETIVKLDDAINQVIEVVLTLVCTVSRHHSLYISSLLDVVISGHCCCMAKGYIHHHLGFGLRPFCCLASFIASS